MTQLIKTGGSTSVAIPTHVLERLHLDVGSKIKLAIRNGRLEGAQIQPRYTLAELLAQCDLNAELTEDEKLWLNTSLEGNENV